MNTTVSKFGLVVLCSAFTMQGLFANEASTEADLSVQVKVNDEQLQNMEQHAPEQTIVKETKEVAQSEEVTSVEEAETEVNLSQEDNAEQAICEEAAPVEEANAAKVAEVSAPENVTEISDEAEVVAVEEEQLEEVCLEQPAAPAEAAVREEVKSAPASQEAETEEVAQQELVSFVPPRCFSESLALTVELASLKANEKYSQEDLVVIFDYMESCSPDDEFTKMLAIHYGVGEGELDQEVFEQKLKEISVNIDLCKQCLGLFLLERAADLPDEERLEAAQACIGSFMQALVSLGLEEEVVQGMEKIFSYQKNQ